MNIRILGSGTPTPSLNRMGSGYLIEIEKDVMLFDCGPGTYHRLLELDIDVTCVTHMFFSHLHCFFHSNAREKTLTHLDLWEIKCKPRPVANAPPSDVFTAYNELCF